MSQTISRSLLGEFDYEMDSTRKSLERVPEDRGDFRPHPKSATLARLAGHLGELPVWGVMTLSQNELDLGGDGAGAVMSTRAALLESFDSHRQKLRALLEACSDAAMMETWTLRAGDRTIFAMPRIAVFRSFVLNHMIHHRAQLGVYLRMLDVPVPSVYGPSADENVF